MPSSSAPVACLALAMLTSCRAVVDSGITYSECELTDYVEPFAKGSVLKDIQEKCWLTANTSSDPADLLLEDGDLVIRTTAPADGGTANWSGETQGALAYQRFEGNFVMATRVEVLDKVNGDNCLEPGHQAGLALRLPDTAPVDWVTFMIEPFQPIEPIPCEETMNILPARGVVSSNRDGLMTQDDKGVDEAGISFSDSVEADIAMCRVGDLLSFYYREPTSDENAPVWRQLGGDFEYQGIAGPAEVGLTVAGSAEDNFRTAAHFQWALLTDTLLTDGCEETLLSLEFPTVE